MPKEIEPNPAQVRHPAAAPAKAGRNLKLQHQVDSYPTGHVLAPHELPGADDRARAVSARRLLSLGAAVETDEPASAPLDESALPPGAAVSHQLVPGDELPPNTLEPPTPPVQREPPPDENEAAKGGKGK